MLLCCRLLSIPDRHPLLLSCLAVLMPLHSCCLDPETLKLGLCSWAILWSTSLALMQYKYRPCVFFFLFPFLFFPSSLPSSFYTTTFTTVAGRPFSSTNSKFLHQLAESFNPTNRQNEVRSLPHSRLCRHRHGRYPRGAPGYVSLSIANRSKLMISLYQAPDQRPELGRRQHTGHDRRQRQRRAL